MNAISWVMAVFSMLGAADRIFGSRLGLGKRFEQGFMLFGDMALTMIGMIAISPLIASALSGAFVWMHETLHLDPSLLPASLFANDMGGATLSLQIAADPLTGRFNAFVVSSMLGCTLSYTIPYAMSAVDRALHRELLLGILCGIVTIPVGCLCGGLVMGLPLGALCVDLLPLALLAGLIAVGLKCFPMLCVRAFSGLGVLMKAVITAGLALCIWNFLTGMEILPGLDTLENGAAVCLNASVVMTGAFPLLYVAEKLLRRPLRRLGAAVGISNVSAMGFIASLATNVTTFEMLPRMDAKGALLNSAFAVSGAFTFAAHLAFTLAYDAASLPAVIIGKLTAGVAAVLLAAAIYKKNGVNPSRQEVSE